MRVAIIPARGGSRRIPRKNIRPFHGKPIIAYSIEAAKQSGLFQAVYVSTEDSEVANVALDYGAIVVRRPWRLAIDEVGTQEVMRDVLNGMSYDEACCIYATVPMLTPAHIGSVYTLMTETGTDYAYIEGWLYWGKASSFCSGVPLEGNSAWMHPDGWIDINTEEDWKRAEEMYEALHQEAA
jgi:CMP-N-acetylneuraminic acid synthetase